MTPLKCLLVSKAVLVICIVSAAVAWAPTAQAVLPPRPPVPTPKPVDKPDRLPSEPVVEQITLQVTNTQQRYWSVVQWQGADGTWHDVTGWRGEVNKGQTRWWVEEKDFGKGPYRWVVYDGENGTMLIESEPFYLPIRGKPLVVSLLLE